MRLTSSLAALALALSATIAHAQDEPKKKDEAAEAPVPAPNVSVTRHKGVFGGKAISYTATTGETYLKDKDGKPLAAIYATSYVKDGGDRNRPITFLYNGGPGSGSLWLHMGAFGPKRVVLPDAQDDGAPPYPLVDNAESLLDVTDLVFIDPVGTGFSHAIGKKDPKDYWGVSADAKSIAEFIRLWLNDNGRWSSPKYIGGESYGTTRSVALINELEGTYNDIAVNGIILISTILDFGASAEVQGNEMPYILNLPDGDDRLVSQAHGQPARHRCRSRAAGARLRHRPLCRRAAEREPALAAGTRQRADGTCAPHRPVRNIRRPCRPARHPRPLLQGIAARPGPQHRPPRHALHRQGL